MASQGIIRVRAYDEGGSVIVEGGRALLGGAAQLRKFRNLAGQLGQHGALNKLAQITPLLLAIMDAVLALKCEEEMVKPKQDRDFARAEAGAMSAVVCPLVVYAGSPCAVGRTGRVAPAARMR